jgi:hypothetical protein
MSIKYTFSVCCRKIAYPDCVVAALVPRRPKADGLCWKILNGALVLLSLGLTGFSIYELASGAAAPTADANRLATMTRSVELFLCGIPSGNGTPRFCFDPTELPAPVVCPELFSVTDTANLVVDKSASSFEGAAIANRAVGIISLAIVMFSYYTLLWRTRSGIQFATCGLSTTCCGKCCCTTEKCGYQCQSCGKDIDGLACGIDFLTMPFLIIMVIFSAFLLIWANNKFYHVQHTLSFRGKDVDLSACTQLVLDDATEASAALFTASATGAALVRTSFFERHAQESAVFAGTYYDNYLQNIWPGGLILVLTVLLLMSDTVNKLWEQSLEQDIVAQRVISETMVYFLAPQPMTMTQMPFGNMPVMTVEQQPSHHQPPMMLAQPQHHQSMHAGAFTGMHTPNTSPVMAVGQQQPHHQPPMMLAQPQHHQSMHAGAFTGMHTPNTSLRMSNTLT